MNEHLAVTTEAPNREQFEYAIAELGLPPEWRVSIEFRRRNTLGIEVRAGGTVTLSIPETAAPEEIACLLAGQVDRMARAVARHGRTAATHPVKELVDGEHFDYLGRTYRLRTVNSIESPVVRLVDDWIELTTRHGAEPCSELLISWYTRRGKEWIASVLPRLARAAGTRPPDTAIRDLGTRWGLREPSGRIAIHWAVVQLPPALIELVLAHELTHLRVNKHSPAFRRELGKLVPDLTSRERLLAELGASAWLGALRDVHS
jgi:predicted metal-dependent hydrolase